MDEQGVVQAIERWRAQGDARALAQALSWMERWLVAPGPVVHVLGRESVEAARDEVLEALLLGDRRLGADVRHPRAFALTVFRNNLRDKLRKHRRQPDLQDPGVVRDLVTRTHAQPVPSAHQRIEFEQQVQSIHHALAMFRFEERAALLLLHAPNRLPEEDWQSLVKQSPPPPPPRPEEALDREAIAQLLFPGTPAPRAYERVGKIIQRAYQKLRHAISVQAEDLEDIP
ncbi:sigma-70 family RNA polymerase sigma factor [Corallococcus exiguus]|uniref:sigma-70 family RNA polymerase sigma factor n=1 Tax=Corallococcus TaxID=83461 RepID=UPI0011E5C255|nr:MULTISPECIES: sigma-70 family RNA polymerase sigma factor [Corallococcus]NNC17632.1 sigma-70 family RNA polymerase sigma factor [Corallococcus exiguus]NPC71037.1 sigma-70 family RNA polymerase sigma factor [Corallococcus exiguus]